MPRGVCKRIARSTGGALHGLDRLPTGRALKDDCRGAGGVAFQAEGTT